MFKNYSNIIKAVASPFPAKPIMNISVLGLQKENEKTATILTRETPESLDKGLISRKRRKNHNNKE